MMLATFGDAVHERGPALLLSVPVDRDAGIAGKPIDHVDDDAVQTTHADRRTRKLTVDHQRRTTMAVFGGWG